MCFFFLFSAEEKLKDKLAIAARDKLASTNKEKLVQAERKRKAAMFAAMLKSSVQEQQLQQQTASERAAAALEAGGQDPAAGLAGSTPAKGSVLWSVEANSRDEKNASREMATSRLACIVPSGNVKFEPRVVFSGAAIPPPLSLLSGVSPSTSRSASPGAATAAPTGAGGSTTGSRSKSSTPARAVRPHSPTDKFHRKRKSR